MLSWLIAGGAVLTTLYFKNKYDEETKMRQALMLPPAPLVTPVTAAPIAQTANSAAPGAEPGAVAGMPGSVLFARGTGLEAIYNEGGYAGGGLLGMRK